MSKSGHCSEILTLASERTLLHCPEDAHLKNQENRFSLVVNAEKRNIRHQQWKLMLLS